MRRFTSVFTGVATVMVWLGVSAGAQSGGGEQFKARLSPVPITSAMLASVAGSGSVTATLKGTTLSIRGTFDGLRSPATIAQIHTGSKGVRGPVLFDLTVAKATSGTISGSFDLTPAQVNGLKQDRFYVQIHSEKAPDGNLWGWLLR